MTLGRTWAHDHLQCLPVRRLRHHLLRSPRAASPSRREGRGLGFRDRQAYRSGHCGFLAVINWTLWTFSPAAPDRLALGSPCSCSAAHSPSGSRGPPAVRCGHHPRQWKVSPGPSSRRCSSLPRSPTGQKAARLQAGGRRDRELAFAATHRARESVFNATTARAAARAPARIFRASVNEGSDRL